MKSLLILITVVLTVVECKPVADSSKLPHSREFYAGYIKAITDNFDQLFETDRQTRSTKEEDENKTKDDKAVAKDTNTDTKTLYTVSRKQIEKFLQLMKIKSRNYMKRENVDSANFNDMIDDDLPRVDAKYDDELYFEEKQNKISKKNLNDVESLFSVYHNRPMFLDEPTTGNFMDIEYNSLVNTEYKPIFHIQPLVFVKHGIPMLPVLKQQSPFNIPMVYNNLIPPFQPNIGQFRQYGIRRPSLMQQIQQYGITSPYLPRQTRNDEYLKKNAYQSINPFVPSLFNPNPINPMLAMMQFRQNVLEPVATGNDGEQTNGLTQSEIEKDSSQASRREIIEQGLKNESLCCNCTSTNNKNNENKNKITNKCCQECQSLCCNHDIHHTLHTTKHIHHHDVTHHHHTVHLCPTFHHSSCENKFIHKHPCSNHSKTTKECSCCHVYHTNHPKNDHQICCSHSNTCCNNQYIHPRREGFLVSHQQQIRNPHPLFNNRMHHSDNSFQPLLGLGPLNPLLGGDYFGDYSELNRIENNRLENNDDGGMQIEGNESNENEESPGISNPSINSVLNSIYGHNVRVLNDDGMNVGQAPGFGIPIPPFVDNENSPPNITPFGNSNLNRRTLFVRKPIFAPIFYVAQ